MVKPDSTAGPSLLPYLRSRMPGVSLSLQPADPSNPDQVFATLEGTGPLADIRLGRVTMDGQSAMLDLFILVQSDQYDVESTELRPFTNMDVENAWQQAWARMRPIQDAGPVPLTLPDQVDAQQNLVPLQSLFYCRHAQLFCHPLCPDCGAALTLCRDDTILNKARITGYTQSLQRYLYCIDCHRISAEEAPFFTKVLPPAPPARVKGCKDLIQAFGKLLSQAELSADLPCLGCDQAANCYGPQSLALERMQAVQFYPFYMLMQPAPTLNALDFLALLSGADPDQVAQHLAQEQKPGRLRQLDKFQAQHTQGSGFLFDHTGRQFLEVFYLKLTFLREMAELIGRGPANSVSRMSMEGLWVYLNQKGRHLPHLWTFFMQLIDPLGQPVKQAVTFDLPQAQVRVFLGAAWFYVLLANAGQSMDDINAGIQRVLEMNGDGSADLYPNKAIDDLFDARHIFWQAPEIPMEPEWQTLWDESLALGMKLLRAGLNADATWSDNDFLQHIDDLRAGVHQTLFTAPTAEPLAEDEKTDRDDQYIAGILTDILQQWAQPATSAVQALEETVVEAPPIMRLGQAMQPNEDGDYAETVILTRDDALGKNGQVPDMEKTVVLGPPDTGVPAADRTRQAPKTGQAPPPGHDLDATVVMPTPSASKPKDDLDATIAMSPPSTPKPKNNLDATVAMSPPSTPKPKDDLDATVVMTQRSAQTPADDLDATVAMSPAPAPAHGGDLDATVVMKPPSVPASGEDLDKTVVMPSSGAPAPHPHQPADAGSRQTGTPPQPVEEDDDELEKTVLIQPGQGKGKKPQP